MAQSPMLELAKADLGSEAMRVLLVVLARLDFENFIALQQAEIGRILGMKASSVSRAVARLVKEGVVLAGPRVGHRGTYRLNPSYGWKGSAKGHQQALLERMKARGISVVVGGGGEGSDELVKDDLTGDLFAE